MYDENTMQKSTFVPIVSVITFTGFLDTHLLIPVMALFASELGLGVGIVGVIVGLYSIINTPANIVFGRLVDRLGAKPLLISGLLLDAAAMFLYALVSLPWHLGLVRVLHGLSGGIVGPASMSAMTGEGDKRSHGRTMSAYGMALAAATLVGYGLGGWLASGFGFDSVFLTGGGLLVVGTVLAFFLPSRSTPAVSVSSGSKTWPQISGLLKRRTLIGPYATVFAQYFSLGGVVTLLPLYVRGLGLEAVNTGMSMAAFSVMFLLVQIPIGRRRTGINKSLLTVIGLLLGMAALLLLPFAGAFAFIALCLALYGIAHGLMFPSISAMVAENTAPEERGLGTGIFHALLTGGVAAGAPVMGWIGGYIGLAWGLAASSGILLMALGVMVLVLRRR